MAPVHRRHRRREALAKYVVYILAMLTESISLNTAAEPILIRASKHEIIVVSKIAKTGIEVCRST